MSITKQQIEALANEAAAAGDDEMVTLCEMALAGDRFGLEEVERVVTDAAAQQ